MLDVRWESSIDGVFSTKSPDSSGAVSFPFAQLSAGQHSIVSAADKGEICNRLLRGEDVSACHVLSLRERVRATIARIVIGII